MQKLTQEETKLQPSTSLGPIHYIPSSKVPPKLPNTIQSLTIASTGNVDSGKSTLIGVLTKGLADDGRGCARKRVFNYPHEEASGRTSSIGHEIMGFDKEGVQVVPERFVQNKNKYWQDVMQNTQKMITFLDLCGHEKYLKTTIYGLVGMQPNYAMIIIGANMGLSRMTREHLGIALALKIPFFVVITKIDIAPENVYQENVAKLVEILKLQNVKRLPFLVKEATEEKEIETVSLSMESNRICPIFSVSAVTLKGMAQLKSFLSKLPVRTINNGPTESKEQQPEPQSLEFDINENFLVPGVGLIVSGVMKSGEANLNQVVQFGPDKQKQFKQVVIKSIHVNRTPVDKAVQGQCACFSLKCAKNTDKLSREEFRKGMMIVDSKSTPQAHWEFTAEVVVLHHSTTINPGYQSVVHCGVIRQAAQVISIQKNEFLRTNDKDNVRFRFLYAPEVVKQGEVLLLREGRTKVLGNVVEVGGEEPKKKKEEFKKVEKAFG